MQEDASSIAVCLATYNGEKYIAEQLESLLSQTYQNFKLYIADDGSTDRTLEVIKDFLKRFNSQIDVKVNEKQLGVVKNFEQLITQSKEPYIACCDQDDIWEPNKLELQLEAIKRAEKRYLGVGCLIHSDLSMIDDKARILQESYFDFRGYKLKKAKDLGHILGPSGVMGNTLMFNKKLCTQMLPFPPSLDTHDYWIGIVAELYGRRITLNEPLVKYRIHTDNVSNSLQRLESVTVYKRMFSKQIKLPYIDSERSKLMEYLLEQKLRDEDRRCIEAFYVYLTFSKSRYAMFFDLMRYSLVKRGRWFRIMLFAKIMLTKKYHNAV